MTSELKEVREALEKAKQGVIEVNKANKSPGSFTGGWDGAMRHRQHWEREKDEAIELALTKLDSYIARQEGKEFEVEVAKAIYYNRHARGEEVMPWAQVKSIVRASFIQQAQAVIATIKGDM